MNIAAAFNVNSKHGTAIQVLLNMTAMPISTDYT
jgi:hypothetical protein